MFSTGQLVLFALQFFNNVHPFSRYTCTFCNISAVCGFTNIYFHLFYTNHWSGNMQNAPGAVSESAKIL